MIAVRSQGAKARRQAATRALTDRSSSLRWG